MNEDIRTACPNSGKFILEQLQRFNSDLNHKQEMSFWLYLPSKNSARQAARQAEAVGLNVEVSSPLNDSPDSDWFCLLYCPHIPDESLLDGISRFCSALASRFKGNFDGWESSLELDEDRKNLLPNNWFYHKGLIRQ